MNRIFLTIILILVLAGCTDDDKLSQSQNIEDVNNDIEDSEVNKIENGAKVNTYSSVSQEDGENEVTEDEIEKEIEPFWEIYTESELLDAVSSGEKVYDFEVEAPMFEAALIESFSNREDKDWTTYLASFTANVVYDAPEGYIEEMYNVHRAILEDSLDLDKAIEHLKKARQIREEAR